MTDADRMIARQGLAKHPVPKVTAAHLRTVADAIEDHGATAERRAALLAARGWPSGTLGSGSRSSDNTSSVERAVGLQGDDDVQPRTDRWVDADRELATRWRQAFTAVARLHEYLGDLVAHADDVDPLPAGTGECQACGRFVRPSKRRPNDRLRSGLCDRDRKAWKRSGLDRQTWLTQHRVDPEEAAAEPLEEDASTCRLGHACCDRAAEHEHWHDPDGCPACQLLRAAS